MLIDLKTCPLFVLFGFLPSIEPNLEIGNVAILCSVFKRDNVNRKR